MESLKPVLERWSAIVPFADQRIGDIGCGAGMLLSYLFQQGAEVCGVEPRAEAVDAANDALGDGVVVQGAAENLPWADQALDMAVFCMSLHHVPQTLMRTALSEAKRVIRTSGHIVIIEPIADGAGYAMERLIDDEAAVRADAADAIADFLSDKQAVCVLDERIAWNYHYQSFDDFIGQMIGIDETRATRAADHREEAEGLFQSGGEITPQGWRFPQDYRLVVMQPSRG